MAEAPADLRRRGLASLSKKDDLGGPSQDGDQRLKEALDIWQERIETGHCQRRSSDSVPFITHVIDRMPYAESPY